MTRICIVLLLVGVTVLAQDTAEQEAKQLAQKAQDLVKSQKFEEAVASLKKAAELMPKNDVYLGMLSDVEFKAGKHADGVEHALAAIKINDKVGAYYTLVATNAYMDQDLDRAREYCELVLKRGPSEFGQQACNDARKVQELMAKKTYTLSWNLDPQKSYRDRTGTIIIALPKNGLLYQTSSFEITGAQSHRLVKGEVNDTLYILPKGNTPIALTTKITVEPYSFKKDIAKATAKPLPADVRAHLGPSFSIDPKSPALKKVVAELKGKTTAETARNIVTWMKKNVEYKLDKKPIEELDFKSVDDIVQRGHAECRGYAMLFVALCRAADIPARPIWGIAIIMPSADRPMGGIASHNWAEFYVAGCGWVPVDPQRPESLGMLPPDCLRFFMDAKKSKNSGETLPVFNLLNMSGDKIKFELSR
jgi:hypothetical protein